MVSTVRPAADVVTIVIVTFQSAHCLPMLGQLLANLPHVIVVDNASSDGTDAAVQQHLPQARFVANTKNLGFGAANNLGLDQVTTPYALLLNPDCEIAMESIEALYSAQRQFPDAGMLAPQILDAQGQHEVNYRWPSPLWRSKGPGATGPCCVGFLCGAVIWLNLSKTRTLAHFDTDFFLYYEDDDLTLRAFSAQIPLLLIPAATAIHRSRGSVKGQAPWRAEYARGFHHARSKIQFFNKHGAPGEATRLKRRTLWLALLTLILRVLLPSPKHIARNAGRVRALL
ncbi:MAG: glycosyltransferase family 2 protein [Burkholderiaceae bacterium]|jgi:N-acetylglucosaminyl-diphospho-decaprenol L-rhamnosyltransferase|nr:glycosyltransferase family 2 protein [Burkholderiaceae bacterium]MDO7595473.1 glycosyltransferase family 2 protein [Burkholderiaceae bacterium]MDO7730365.1 glycosyltransferase family 2 protein [Burkholderiaceae bacterium]